MQSLFDQPAGFPLLPILLILGVVIGTGCGGNVDDDAGGELRRLSLTNPPGTEIEAPRDLELAAWSGLDQPGVLDAWKLGETRRTIASLEGRQVISLDRKKALRIEIPTALRFHDTPRVRLSLVLRGRGCTLRGTLLGAGAEVSSAEVFIIKSRTLQRVELTFPAATDGELECDALLLEFPKGEMPLGLESITVDDVPMGGFLPAGAFSRVELIEIENEARRGSVLTSARSTATLLGDVSSNQTLSFSYAMPASLRRPGTAPKLEVVLRGESGREIRKQFEFESAATETARWHSARIPLGPIAGGEVEAHFQLVTDADATRICIIGEPNLVSPSASPPTVLLVTSDTHRSDHVGFVAGEDGPLTATLDRLAREGVAFTDALSSINNTTPSHVALFTGLTPRDTGIVANAKVLADAAPTLAECFRDLGYATLASVSAAPVSFQFCGLGQGFDRYSNPNYRSARDSRETLDQLLAWLPEYEDQPLFVWLHVYDAHSPYDPPREYTAKYYPDEADPFDVSGPKAALALAPDWNATIADPDYTEALYKGEVTYVDEKLGELLALARFQDAAIAFTADHGEVLRVADDSRYGHRSLSRSTLAVPLIFRAPTLAPSSRRAEPVQQIDVGRTLLNLAGHADMPFPGTDLLAGELEARRPRFALQSNGFAASVTRGEWMLRLGLRDLRSGYDKEPGWYHRVELFNVQKDEACTAPLEEEFPEVTAKLRRLLVRWLAQRVQNDWESTATVANGDRERHLAELGYVSVEGGAGMEAWIDPDCDCPRCQAFE